MSVVTPDTLAGLRSSFSRLDFADREDPYLADVARRVPSHAFLGKSTLSVYLRQVDFLAKALCGYFGRDAGDIRVLDWGCGKGHIAYLLRQARLNVTAADVVQEAGDSAFHQQTPILQEQGIAPVQLGHPVQLPFKDASFDCVTSFGVLEHVQADLASLKEICRVLKPGGLLYITFLPYRTSWTQALAKLGGDHYHDRLYTRSGVRHLAQQTGFEVLGMHFGQLFPKNPVPRQLSPLLEPIDQILCRYTPLGLLATNLEVLMRSAPAPA